MTIMLACSNLTRFQLSMLSRDFSLPEEEEIIQCNHSAGCRKRSTISSPK